MSENLAQLSKLFTAFQAEVTELERSQTQLSGTIVTLKSQCTFQEGQLETLKADVLVAEAKKAELTEVVDGLKATIQDLGRESIELGEKLTKEQNRLNAIIQTIEDKQEAAQTELRDLDTQKHDLLEAIAKEKAVLDELVVQQVTATEKVATLDSDLAEREAEVDQKLLLLSSQESAAEKERFAMDREIEAKKAELATLDTGIAEATSALADQEAQYKIFQNREDVGKKKLLAREAAILAREKAYDEAVARAKRPGGILSGIDL